MKPETPADLARLASSVQGFHRRRAQQLRARGQGGMANVGALVKAFLATSGLRQQARHAGEVAEAFDAALAAAAPNLASRVRLLTLKGGRLYVDCPSAAHLAELRTFHAPRVLAAMRERLPGFRVEAIVGKLKGGGR